MGWKRLAASSLSSAMVISSNLTLLIHTNIPDTFVVILIHKKIQAWITKKPQKVDKKRPGMPYLDVTNTHYFTPPSHPDPPVTSPISLSLSLLQTETSPDQDLELKTRTPGHRGREEVAIEKIESMVESVTSDLTSSITSDLSQVRN